MIDFSRFIPARENERAKGWQAEVDQREADQRRAERERRLDRARDCRLTASMRLAIESGGLADTEALRGVRRWAASGRPLLILAGGVGCGKSVAAAWLIAEVGGGVWLPAEQGCRIFAASYGQQFNTAERARDCPLLVLDDVGTEFDPLRMQHVLTELLEARKSAQHRTVITTNLAKGMMEQRYRSERLWSRMAELATWSYLTGPDLRRRGDSTP